MKDFDKYRKEFPLTEKYVYLNHAAISPVSIRVSKAVAELFEEFSREGIAGYPKWEKRVNGVRGLFAGLVKASLDEIAYIENTSEGLSTIAEGIEWKKGDEVIVPESEFPSNIYPWMNLERRGVGVNFIKRRDGRFGVEDVKKALKSGTKLLSVSSVDFVTGFRCDLKALGDFCKEKGILFCVDAIQSLGVIPMDVKEYGIHFLASGGHKWLLSAMGCGCLFISKEVNDLVRPVKAGWKSVVDEENFFRVNFEMKPDALRFEPGTMNLPGIYALGEALELLMEVGIESVYDRILMLNDFFVQGLEDRGLKVITPMGREERSGIISFIPHSKPQSLFEFLKNRGISISLRDRFIRLSPHFYNIKNEVSRFFKSLDEFRV